MTRAARVLAVAALLSAPAAQAFMFAGGPCGGMTCSPGATAAMKAINKFQPKVDNNNDAVTFKFECEAQGDVEVSTSKIGGAGAMLNVNFKKADFPFFQGMKTSAGLSRSFFMPPTISADEMTSSWEAGVLTVTLPKTVQDQVNKQQRAQPAAKREQQPAASSSADYLKSLSTPQRPKAAGQPKPKAEGSSATSQSSTEPATAGQYIDQLLSEMFGVPAGADLFTPPSAEWLAAQEERAAAAKAAHAARRAAVRRANMHTTWDQTDSAYTVTIEIPQGTRAGAVKLVAAEGRALEVRLANGGVKRIQLPRDARISGVKAKFERDGEDKSIDLVARCVVTVPKEQPQSINIEMA